MGQLGEVVLLLVLMTNFAVLVTDRLSACIRIMAVHGVLLALLPLASGTPFGFHVGVLTVGTILIKAVVLPRILTGEATGAAEVATLGHGGLLSRDSAYRFPPYRKSAVRGELSE